MLEDASRATTDDDVIGEVAFDDRSGSNCAVCPEEGQHTENRTTPANGAKQTVADLARSDNLDTASDPHVVAELDWVSTLVACDSLVDVN